MSELFTVASTIATPIAKGPSQIEAGLKRGPTTTTTALEVVPVQTPPVSMIYISATSIHALAQRKARTESQLTYLLQQICPWVCQAISEAEA